MAESRRPWPEREGQYGDLDSWQSWMSEQDGGDEILAALSGLDLLDLYDICCKLCDGTEAACPRTA